MSVLFSATREAGLSRLSTFAPRAGAAYASGRNSDFGPGERSTVSALSPYIRYRLLTEGEVVGAVLARQSFAAVEKFVQEVCWRTYWKGWLEMRPSVWSRFLSERDQQREGLADTAALSAAEAGTTGIEGFDDWARELVETGYLHNHARMWFASIWIFTLRLPWALGADFFLRHLIDADAASNTLSWRWVAGLQTVGKTYLATTDNIRQYSNGRFAPKGLATQAVALTEAPVASAAPLPLTTPANLDVPSLLLVTAEDFHPESVIDRVTPVSAALVVNDPDLLWGEKAQRFVTGASADTRTRVSRSLRCPVEQGDSLTAEALMTAAEAAGTRQIVTPYAPVGAVADRLVALAPDLADAGFSLHQVRRGWDEGFWPHAKKGFFPFKERIPEILREQGGFRV